MRQHVPLQPDPRDTNISLSMPVVSREGLAARLCGQIADHLVVQPDARVDIDRSAVAATLVQAYGNGVVPPPLNYTETLAEERRIVELYTFGTPVAEDLHTLRLAALGAVAVD